MKPRLSAYLGSQTASFLKAENPAFRDIHVAVSEAHQARVIGVLVGGVVSGRKV